VAASVRLDRAPLPPRIDDSELVAATCLRLLWICSGLLAARPEMGWRLPALLALLIAIATSNLAWVN